MVRQGTATVSCDSLWWDTRSQRFTAHGQVVYRKGKGQTVRSRNLTYDQVLAYFTGNVRAEQDRMIIHTESLSVLVADGTARWTQGAKIQLTDGSLTCRTGVLDSKSGVHRFEKSVVLQQKDGELRSEWVEYDDRSQWAWIRSAGELKRDSTQLTFAAGRWNSKQEEGLFWGPALARQPHSILSGDTLMILEKGWSSRGRAHLFNWQRNDSLALRADRLDAYMGGNPLISGWNDSNQVDQMAGKRAHGFFTSSGLEQVILRRNAQARYHTWDKSKYLGINSITGPVLILDFIESALDRVRVNGSTSGVLEPSIPGDPAQPLPGYLDRRAEQLSRTEAISGRK
jgi:lipopolysaccharide export system protein LptA